MGAVIVTICALIVLGLGGWIAYFPDDAGAVARGVRDFFNAVVGDGSPDSTADSTAEEPSAISTSADLKPGMCLTLDPAKQPLIEGDEHAIDEDLVEERGGEPENLREQGQHRD